MSIVIPSLPKGPPQIYLVQDIYPLCLLSTPIEQGETGRSWQDVIQQAILSMMMEGWSHSPAHVLLTTRNCSNVCEMKRILPAYVNDNYIRPLRTWVTSTAGI